MKTRKELLQEYKNRPLSMGVYQIRNLVNGKIYIDSSMNLGSIFNRVKIELQVGKFTNVNLQREWNEFGEENFLYEILAEIKENGSDEASYKKEIKSLCQMFIEDLEPYNEKGYNKPRLT